MFLLWWFIQPSFSREVEEISLSLVLLYSLTTLSCCRCVRVRALKKCVTLCHSTADCARGRRRRRSRDPSSYPKAVMCHPETPQQLKDFSAYITCFFLSSHQILIESGGRATEFEELAVDVGSTLLPDMLVDSTGEHIYTISQSKVCLSNHSFFLLLSSLTVKLDDDDGSLPFYKQKNFFCPIFFFS